MTPKARILFVCRHNSSRSQLAAALARKISHGRVEAESAGPEPTAVPEIIKGRISALGLPVEQIESRHLNQVADQSFDMIITLCDKSHQMLPELPQDTQHIRWDFQHAETTEDVHHLEIELAERIRLLMLAKRL